MRNFLVTNFVTGSGGTGIGYAYGHPIAGAVIGIVVGSIIYILLKAGDVDILDSAVNGVFEGLGEIVGGDWGGGDGGGSGCGGGGCGSSCGGGE